MLPQQLLRDCKEVVVRAREVHGVVNNVKVSYGKRICLTLVAVERLTTVLSNRTAGHH